MSFNIGETNSRFVAVSNVTMKFEVSEKMVFADLRTSRKTGRFKFDKDGYSVKTDAHGKPIEERVYTYWEGRFVGDAFEPAKALRSGQPIDIVNGWMEKETWTGKDGKRREKVFVVISDFRLSDTAEDEADDSASVEADAYRALNGDDNLPL